MVFTRDKKKSIKKRYNLILWTTVIAVLFFSYSSARLSLKELKSIQITRIGNNPKQLIINPQGPLNLLRGYIYQKCGFMYNKRLYAPEIDINYSFRFKKDSRLPFECSFERSVLKDEAYESGAISKIFGSFESLLSSTARNEEYMYRREYHNTLIKLFREVNKSGICTARNTAISFTFFLKKKIAQKDKNVFCVLAALFLLSEGVDVPIECVDDKIVLKKKHSNKYLFSLDITVTGPHLRYSHGLYFNACIDTIDIIKFFKNNTGKVRPEPKSMEEFKQGDFLDTPQFLMQAYLFDFIETVEQATELNEAVYEILCDVYPEEKMQIDNPNSTEESLPDCFSKYFLFADKSIEETCGYIKQLEQGTSAAIEKESFMQYLVEHCIGSNSAGIKKDSEAFKKYITLIKELVEDDLKDINRLFIVKKIAGNNQKRFIIGCCLSWAAQNEINLTLDSESRIVRFTSNILASVSSENRKTQIDLLKPLIYSGYDLNMYGRVYLPNKSILTSELVFLRAKELKTIDYIICTGSKKVLFDVLEKYALKCDIESCILSNISEITKIFEYLFSDNSTDAFRVIFDSYFGNYNIWTTPRAHNISLVWFVIACEKKAEYPEFIQKLYDRVDIHNVWLDNISTTEYTSSEFFEEKKAVVSGLLTSMKEELVKRKGDQTKFDRIWNFFNPTSEVLAVGISENNS